MLLSKPKIFFLIIVGQFISMASTCWAQQAAGTTTPSERPNGMITGRVVNSAGEPLSGAVVYASSLAAPHARKGRQSILLVNSRSRVWKLVSIASRRALPAMSRSRNQVPPTRKATITSAIR